MIFQLVLKIVLRTMSDERREPESNFSLDAKISTRGFSIMAEVPCLSMEVAATVLIRPVPQRQGGKFFALPRTSEELRREVAWEFSASETFTIFNQDRGEIKDVTLLQNRW